MQRRAAVVATTIADLTQQREAATADYTNQLKQKQEKVLKAQAELTELTATRDSVVADLEELLDRAEQSRAQTNISSRVGLG